MSRMGGSFGIISDIPLVSILKVITTDLYSIISTFSISIGLTGIRFNARCRFADMSLSFNGLSQIVPILDVLRP